MITNTLRLIIALSLCIILPNMVSADAPKRKMNVRQGPETVFSQPVSEIVPGLAGAKATRENGRVGGEFVFWGYTLADGTPAYFYACAAGAGVDCLNRRDKVCTASMRVLAENLSMGQVMKLKCTAMCTSMIPNEESGNPCCKGGQTSSDLEVGLVSCGN